MPGAPGPGRAAAHAKGPSLTALGKFAPQPPDHIAGSHGANHTARAVGAADRDRADVFTLVMTEASWPAQLAKAPLRSKQVPGNGL